MPEMDGFQLLERLTFRDFDLIITSACDNYAIKAFKEHAVDYLLKPIDSEDLLKAVNRVRENQKRNALGDQLKNIIKAYVPEKKFARLAMPVFGKTIFVDFEDILYCKSDGSYTEVHFNTNNKELLSKKLKEIEAQTDDLFFRLHNSYLVNLLYVKEYVKNDGPYLVLSNGVSIPVSRAKKNELLQILNS